MAFQTLAHLSDLHVGRSLANDSAAARLVEAMLRADIDHVVVTGDVTHRGRREELRRFQELFAPLRGRVTVVPGNHDRCGDDVGSDLMPGGKVQVLLAAGLYLVLIDSTAPHNKATFRSHGELPKVVLESVLRALAAAPTGALSVVLLHHHPLPQAEESVGEWVASLLGWPHAAELAQGSRLLELARGRCDLVLHGHRHVPRQVVLAPAPGNERVLRVCNAGSSTELSKVRVFEHVEGRLLRPPTWLSATARITPTWAQTPEAEAEAEAELLGFGAGVGQWPASARPEV